MMSNACKESDIFYQKQLFLLLKGHGIQCCIGKEALKEVDLLA